MEIFGDEKKNKIAEETEPQRVAVRVSVALLGFVADNPNSDFGVEPNKNPITLRKKHLATRSKLPATARISSE